MIKSFDGFMQEKYSHYSPVQEGSTYSHYNPIALGIEDLFQLHESQIMPKFNLMDFKAIFRGPLLESEGYVDQDLLERTHAYYELAMLGTAKKEWLESEGPIYSIPAGEHTILIKNNESFILSETTIRMINEGWSLADAVSEFNKLKNDTVNFIKATVKTAAEAIKKSWDAVANAAKRAYEMAKTLTEAAAEFFKEKTALEWAGLSCGVLGAVASALGQPLLSGTLLLIAGGIHIYEGYVKSSLAVKKLATIKSITPFSKIAGTLAVAAPDLVMGTVLGALGFNDLITGATTIMNPNPANATMATVVKVQAESGAKQLANNFVKSLQVPGHALHDGIEKAVLALLPKINAKIAGSVGTAIVALIGDFVLAQLLDGVISGVLKTIQLLLDGITFLLDLPGKISFAIDKAIKGAESTIGKIIAKGLEVLVKPLTDSAKKFIDKYIRPTIEDVKKRIDMQIVSYEEVKRILKGKKEFEDLASGIVEVKAVQKPLINPKDKITGQTNPGDMNNLNKVDKAIFKPGVRNSAGYRDATAIQNQTAGRFGVLETKEKLIEAGYGAKPAGWRSFVKNIFKNTNPEMVTYANAEGIKVASGPNSERIYLSRRYFQFPKGKAGKVPPVSRGHWKFAGAKKTSVSPDGLRIVDSPDK